MGLSQFPTWPPGARTAWHPHPCGQTLYVISGVGRFQTKGEPVKEIKAGDVIWIPPGEKHWHGGAPTTGMVHIATQEAQDGKTANWMALLTQQFVTPDGQWKEKPGGR